MSRGPFPFPSYAPTRTLQGLCWERGCEAKCPLSCPLSWPPVLPQLPLQVNSSPRCCSQRPGREDTQFNILHAFFKGKKSSVAEAAPQAAGEGGMFSLVLLQRDPPPLLWCQTHSSKFIRFHEYKEKHKTHKLLVNLLIIVRICGWCSSLLFTL